MTDHHTAGAITARVLALADEAEFAQTLPPLDDLEVQANAMLAAFAERLRNLVRAE